MQPRFTLHGLIKKTLAICILLSTAMAFPSGIAAQQQFKRGLETITFLPKGQWIGGVSVNYTQSHQDNYQFLILENINGDTYSFKVSPMAFYAFHNNLAAGVRFAYQRQKTEFSSADLILDSETSYSVDNLYSISQNYYGTLAFRNYISLGQSTRFGFFDEVQLQLGGGQSKIINGTGEDITGTYARNFDLNIGLSPGFIMFLNNYSAIEVSVGVLGFGYNHTHATTDRVHVAKADLKRANFKVNLFSISFGVAFYI